MELYKKENKDLKETVNSLHIELTDKEVSEYTGSKDMCVCVCVVHMLCLYVSLLCWSVQYILSAALYMTFKLWHCGLVRPGLILCSLSVHLQSNFIDLKDHASSLASSGLKRDSKLKSLEIAIEQKKEECSKLETQLQKVRVCFAAQNHSSRLILNLDL